MPPRIHTLPCVARPLQRQTRTFTTTRPTNVQPKTNALSLLPRDTAPPPPYPYGHSHFYKQRNHGLYGNAMIQFGNNVSERTEIKTRRRWHPNIVVKSIYSRALGRSVRVKVSTRVLRTIDKVGGLDGYLMGGKAGRVRELGEEGWRLRWAVVNAPSMKKRVKAEPVVRGLLEGWQDEAEEVQVEEKVGARRRAQRAVRETLAEEEGGMDVEEVVRRRIRGLSHMAEQAAPLSMWQRVRRAVSKPFTRN